MSAPSDALLLERQGSVATITLNHPERANALYPGEFHALAALLKSEGADPEVRAIVLTGQGERAFCAGLNLADRDAIRADIASAGPTGLGAVLRVAFGLEVPLIARLNGSCVAGGMGLLGACDYAISVSTARYGLPEIPHGMIPHVALAGIRGRARDEFLEDCARTGDLIDAPTALSAGLIDKVCEREELDAAVERFLAGVLNGSVPVRMQRRLAADMLGAQERFAAADAAARSGAKSSTVDSIDDISQLRLIGGHFGRNIPV